MSERQRIGRSQRQEPVSDIRDKDRAALPAFLPFGDDSRISAATLWADAHERERKRVVAYLRERAALLDHSKGYQVLRIADAIERGEHVK